MYANNICGIGKTEFFIFLIKIKMNGDENISKSERKLKLEKKT